MLAWLQTNGWVITFVGVIVNLGWNFYNQRRTTQLQKSVRSSTVELEEFRSRVRAPIENALVEIGTERNTLRSLASSGKTLDDLRTEIRTVWMAIVNAHLRLGDALAEADRSAFASGRSWTELSATSWDRTAGCIDKALSPVRSETETREGTKEAVSCLGTLIADVRNRIDDEVSRHRSA